MPKCRVCRRIINGNGRRYCKRHVPPINQNGYIYIYRPDHPRANRGGYVREHLVIMEEKLDRSLKSGEVIHHINGEKDDNRPDNLMLFNSDRAHLQYHAQIRRIVAKACLKNITDDEWLMMFPLLHGETEHLFRLFGFNHYVAKQAADIAGRASNKTKWGASTRYKRGDMNCYLELCHNMVEAWIKPFSMKYVK